MIVKSPISVRLDRALGNHHWIKLYAFAILSNLPFTWSDHAPIVLNLSPSTPHIKYNSFRFEAKWLLNDDFFDLVKNIWSNFIKD